MHKHLIPFLVRCISFVANDYHPPFRTLVGAPVGGEEVAACEFKTPRGLEYFTVGPPSAVRAVAEPAAHSLHLVKAEIGRVVQHNPAHNGLNSDIALCRRANFRLMRRNKRTYSITSSARPSSGTGISRPSDFAVFMLTTTSSLVTRCTPPTRLAASAFI